jgi:hypothetical protein
LQSFTILLISFLFIFYGKVKADCDYSTSLKTDFETSIFGLLEDVKGQFKFEASDVILVDNEFYIVCDSSWMVTKASNNLPILSTSNIQIEADPDYVKDEDSQFEAIFYDQQEGFFLVRETVDLGDGLGSTGTYPSVTYQVELDENGTSYTVLEVCTSEYLFKDANKGIEGALGLRGSDGELYMLGLCEGNQCESGGAIGKGIVLIMSRSYDEEGTCTWKTIREMSIPSSVQFDDFAAISLRGTTVAIVSQEDSKLWIGSMTMDKNGNFDPDNSELIDNGLRYSFPVNDNCDIIYCNVEGFAWIDDVRFVSVSDQMKSSSNYRCLNKDQSAHLFSFPSDWH